MGQTDLVLANFKPHYKANSNNYVVESQKYIDLTLIDSCCVLFGTDKIVLRFEILVENANSRQTWAISSVVSCFPFLVPAVGSRLAIASAATSSTFVQPKESPK